MIALFLIPAALNVGFVFYMVGLCAWMEYWRFVIDRQNKAFRLAAARANAARYVIESVYR